MDEMFRGRAIWIGLGVLALMFLCLVMAGLVVAMLVPHGGPGYAVVPQAPAAGESASVPPPTYGYAPLWSYGRGPFGIVGFGIGLMVRLLVFGLLLLLFFRVAGRILWGRRHWGHRYWGPYWGGRPPEGKEGQDAPTWGPGPWGWHHHRHWGPPPWWGQEPEKGSGADRPDTAEAEYTGPQE